MFSSWVSNSFLLQKLRGLKSGGCPFRFGKLEFFQQHIFYCRSSVWVWGMGQNRSKWEGLHGFTAKYDQFISGLSAKHLHPLDRF